MNNQRKIIQISIASGSFGNEISTVCETTLVALCDDGSLWMKDLSPKAEWISIKEIPGKTTYTHPSPWVNNHSNMDEVDEIT